MIGANQVYNRIAKWWKRTSRSINKISCACTTRGKAIHISKFVLWATVVETVGLNVDNCTEFTQYSNIFVDKW